MSRREIVIIIAIVNVVVLSVIFLTARRIEELPPQAIGIEPVPVELSLVTDIPQTQPSVASVRSSAPSVMTVSDIPVDEVDTVLRDFAAAVAVSQQRQTLPPPPVAAAQHRVPATQPPSPSVAASGHSEVVVKRGDFLLRIANQYGVSVEAIKAFNHLRTDDLKVGQVLRIPPSESKVLAATVVAPELPLPAVQATDGQLYRVKSGDSPWKIAKQFHVGVEDLLRLNNLDEKSARNLKPGDTIRVQ